MNNINLNSHCVNANIKAHILSDDQMQTAGFRYIKSDNKNNLGEWVYIHRLDWNELSHTRDFSHE